MANRFVLNETSYHGASAITEIATEAIGRGFKKAFVCSDPDLIKFGVTKKVTDVLDNASLSTDMGLSGRHNNSANLHIKYWHGNARI